MGVLKPWILSEKETWNSESPVLQRQGARVWIPQPAGGESCGGLRSLCLLRMELRFQGLRD